MLHTSHSVTLNKFTVKFNLKPKSKQWKTCDFGKFKYIDYSKNVYVPGEV